MPVKLEMVPKEKQPRISKITNKPIRKYVKKNNNAILRSINVSSIANGSNGSQTCSPTLSLL